MASVEEDLQRLGATGVDSTLQRLGASSVVDQDLQRLGAQPASRGPLDPNSATSPLGRSVRWISAHIPDVVKRPAAAFAGGVASRLDAATAAAMEPFANPVQKLDEAMRGKYAKATGQPVQPPLPEYPPMGSDLMAVPRQAGKVLAGAVLGKSPVQGAEPGMATDELVRRTLGEYHALTPEQADNISRLTLGFPVGEMARAMTGNEGLSLALQAPAYEGANLLGGALWKGAREATGKIPAVAAQRAIGGAKTKAVRLGLAEQGEQHLELAKLKQGIEAVAKQTGEDFQTVDERIRTARMMRPMDKGAAWNALSPEEQKIAQGFDAFDQSQVAQDLSANLKPGVRHAHIEDARQKALAAIQSGNAKAAKKAVARFEELVAPSGIAVPRTLQGKIDLQGAQQVLQKTPEMLTGHAASVPTPEAQAVLSDIRGTAGGGGQGGPTLSKMGVPQTARIMGNRSLTAAEKQARYETLVSTARPGVDPPPLYKTMLESTMIRGDQRAARRASASFIRDIGSAPFAQKVAGNVVPEGTVRLSELRTPKSGFLPSEIADMENTVVPRRKFNAARAALENIQSAPKQAQDIMAKGGRFWKQMVLLRTGYTVRNVADNMISAAQFGAKGEYAVPAIKASLLAHGAPFINPNERIPGLGMTLGEYVQKARRSGELSGGFMTSEIPHITGKNPVTKAVGKSLEGWKNTNAVLENSARATLGMSQRAMGLSDAEVGQLVDDALGKYHPAFQSPTERAITTYVFPWYNWMKQITKRSLRLGIERPGSVAAAEQFQAETNRAEGMKPSEVMGLGPDVKSSGAFVRQGPKGSTQVFPTSVYGPTDINRMFGTEERGPMALLSNPGLQAYPPVQWLAAAAGLNLFKAKPFTGENVELPQSAKVLILLPNEVKQSLGLKVVGNRIMGPDRLDYILRQSGPQAIAIGDIASNDPQSQRKALAFWTGLSSYLRQAGESEKIQRGIERGTRKDERGIKVKSKLNEKRSRQNQQFEQLFQQ